MIPKPFRQFIYQLKKATDDLSVEWHPGAPDFFYCNHKGATLHLGHDVHGDTGEAAYIFKVISGGKETPFIVYEGEDDYREMQDLFASVAGNANDVNEVLKGFFE